MNFHQVIGAIAIASVAASATVAQDLSPTTSELDAADTIYNTIVGDMQDDTPATSLRKAGECVKGGMFEYLETVDYKLFDVPPTLVVNKTMVAAIAVGDVCTSLYEKAARNGVLDDAVGAHILEIRDAKDRPINKVLDEGGTLIETIARSTDAYYRQNDKVEMTLKDGRTLEFDGRELHALGFTAGRYGAFAVTGGYSPQFPEATVRAINNDCLVKENTVGRNCALAGLVSGEEAHKRFGPIDGSLHDD